MLVEEPYYPTSESEDQMCCLPFSFKIPQRFGKKAFLRKGLELALKGRHHDKKLVVNPSEGGEADPLALCYLLNEDGQGDQELQSPKRILGSGNRTLGSSLLPVLRWPLVEEFGGTEVWGSTEGAEVGPLGGLAWKDSQRSLHLELEGLKVSPCHMLSNRSHTSPPPATANFNAKLFIIATQQHCTEVSEPISVGRMGR